MYQGQALREVGTGHPATPSVGVFPPHTQDWQPGWAEGSGGEVPEQRLGQVAAGVPVASGGASAGQGPPPGKLEPGTEAGGGAPAGAGPWAAGPGPEAGVPAGSEEEAAGRNALRPAPAEMPPCSDRTEANSHNALSRNSQMNELHSYKTHQDPGNQSEEKCRGPSLPGGSQTQAPASGQLS